MTNQDLSINQLSFDPEKLANLNTTSAKIRYLTDLGMKRSLIAKTLNIRYQWVRNVQITPLKKQ